MISSKNFIEVPWLSMFDLTYSDGDIIINIKSLDNQFNEII